MHCGPQKWPKILEQLHWFGVEVAVCLEMVSDSVWTHWDSTF